MAYQENNTQVSRSFLMDTNEYIRHRLDKYLHLDWNIPAGEYENENMSQYIRLIETSSEKELSAELITFEIPEGLLS